MKKRIIYGIISIFIGYVIGNIIFTNKDFIIRRKEEDKYYFIQEGIYYDNKILESNNNSNKLIEKADNKINVYVGITKNLEVAEKIINIYEENNIKLSIVEKYFTNEEMKNNVEQFDLLILSSKDKEEIIKIEEVVLASYEEIIKNNETL